MTLIRMAGMVLSLLFSAFGSAQTTVWNETFSGYSNQTTFSSHWTTTAYDTDDCGVNCGTNFWGTYNGAFRCNDIEGPGSNCQNYLTSIVFDISSFDRVTVSADFWFTGALECPGNNASDDILHFQYRIDNGPWTTFNENGYVCGSMAGTNTASSLCLSGDSIRLRVMLGNKANDENTYFDNLKILGYNISPIELPNVAVACSDGAVTLHAFGGLQYTWYVDGTLACSNCDSLVYNPSLSDSLIVVEYIDSAGCSGVDSLPVSFSNSEIPGLLPSALICGGDTLSVQELPGQSWLWSTGSVNSSTTVNSAGPVWLEITDSLGCTFRDTIQVTLKPTPDVDLGPDTSICSGGGTHPLFVPNTYDAYAWGQGSAVIDSGTAVISVNESGTYWVWARKNECTASDTVQITLSPSLNTLSLGPDTLICNHTVTELEFIPYLGGVDPGSVNFFWQNGTKAPTFTVSKSGHYFVNVFNVCDTLSDTVKVTFGVRPMADLEPQFSICPFDDLVIDLEVELSDKYEYNWSDGETGFMREIHDFGVYTVTVSSVCGSLTKTTEVVPRDWPESVLQDVLELQCQTDVTTLTVEDSSAFIRWSTGETTPSIVVGDTGLYYVDITVCDSTLRDYSEVRLLNDPDAFKKQLFPNVITPNADGFNDEFRLLIETTLVSDFELSVYNRWGARVYVSGDPLEAWEGKTNGDRDRHEGIFFYTTRFYHECMGQVEDRGSLTILR